MPALNFELFMLQILHILLSGGENLQGRICGHSLNSWSCWRLEGGSRVGFSGWCGWWWVRLKGPPTENLQSPAESHRKLAEVRPEAPSGMQRLDPSPQSNQICANRRPSLTQNTQGIKQDRHSSIDCGSFFFFFFAKKKNEWNATED